MAELGEHIQEVCVLWCLVHGNEQYTAEVRPWIVRGGPIAGDEQIVRTDEALGRTSLGEEEGRGVCPVHATEEVGGAPQYASPQAQAEPLVDQSLDVG